MPSPINASKIGISVNVAKYHIPPIIEATRFDWKLSPPTQLATICSGIRAPTNPVTRTPPNKSGMIDLEKFHICSIHSPSSSRLNHFHAMVKTAIKKPPAKYQRW